MKKILSTLLTQTTHFLLVMLLVFYSYRTFALADCRAVQSTVDEGFVEKAALLVDTKQVEPLCAFYVAWAWQNEPDKARPYIERIKDSLNKREPFYYKALYLKLLLLDDLTENEHRRALNRLSNVEPKLAKKIKYQSQKLAHPEIFIPLNKPEPTKPALAQKPYTEPLIEPLTPPTALTLIDKTEQKHTAQSNLSTLSVTPQTQSNRTDKLVFIYVHGLGGNNKETSFVHNLKEFIKENQFANFKVVHYSWDSPAVRWRVAASDFIGGKKKAETEAQQFIQVIREYESQKIPYYLIGHSLGAYLIVKAFEHQHNPLRMLRGVFFMGAAVLRNYTINSTALLPKFKIINYYSENFDKVLPLVYNVEGRRSGGQVGFDDITHFKNFRTTCTHSYKGIGIHRDYSTLAEAIGYIMMLKENIFISNHQDFQIKTKGVIKWIMRTAWHDIFEITGNRLGENRTFLIQQRWNTHTYRVVIKDKKGDFHELVNGKSLHAMLRALELY